MNCVSAILKIVLIAIVYHILLILGVLDWNRWLVVLLVRGAVVRVDVAALLDVGLDCIAPCNWTGT